MRQRYENLDESERRVDDPATRKPPRALRWVTGTIAALCVAIAIIHVAAVFLHVAPSNPISQRYSKQIDAWIYPLFEQNWLLFAPNPDSTKTQIFARTGWLSAAGAPQESEWFDISAVDRADTKHNPFPSHATQNMLRRSWSAYLDSHGDDDVSYDEWAVLREEYLRNIAVQRVAAHSSQPFREIQLKVVTTPIAPPNPSDTSQTDSTEPYTRILPWWNATSDGD